MKKTEQMSEGLKGEAMGLFLTRSLYLKSCTSEQITTTLLRGTELKDESHKVILYSELQQESKFKCPSSSINVASTHLRASPSLGL